ncbi:MAG: MarR family transcriptional regulator [Actinomycetota bacterium]|nr:MarR family transcriptional regulator [Actinomycetota bacterium]
MTPARNDRGRRDGRNGNDRERTSFTADDYRAILRFRTRIRRFLAWSGDQARAAGITPAQHQLLLAVRGHDDAEGPTIGDIADYLQLRHHSAVGLVDRAEAAGLVRRAGDPHDRRLAHVQLRAEGARVLERLTALHLSELRSLAGGTLLPDLPAELDDGTDVDDAAGARTGAPDGFPVTRGG